MPQQTNWGPAIAAGMHEISQMFGRGRGSGANPYLALMLQNQQEDRQRREYEDLLRRFGGEGTQSQAPAPMPPTAVQGASPMRDPGDRPVVPPRPMTPPMAPQMVSQGLPQAAQAAPQQQSSVYTPRQMQALQTLGGTQAGRTAGTRMAADWATASPEMKKDVNGNWRFTTGAKAGQRVFPGVVRRPDDETTFTVDPETGEVSFRQGPAGQDAGASDSLAKRTVGTIEDKLLNIGDIQQSLRGVRQKFDPQMLTFQGKGAASWATLKDRFGMASPEEKQTVNDFVQFRAESGQVFSTILNDISGVAINPSEFKRAEGWIPNAGAGIFDGDSPEQFKAKLGRMEEFQQNALARYTMLRNRGIDPSGETNPNRDMIPLDSMPKIIQTRVDQKEREILLANPNYPRETLHQILRDLLATEFGLQ